VSAEVLIRADGVAKKFARTLRRSMSYGLRDIMVDAVGLPRRPAALRRDEFWALRDVSFEVRRGEVLGVIGANGSGKTTLLSMLNGIFRPDAGRIDIRGRVGALIQLGAGFHSMLSGRENIYINGSILGMSKTEIDRKYDQIVEFSGVSDFIDTPIKHYSSGMYVRLGFSVAVHLEPDVLLVDEVLAVGDAEFRSRAMDRMWTLVSSGKSAVVFVSHNMVAVEGFCERVLLLENGFACTGSKAEMIGRYLGDDTSKRWEGVDPEVRRVMLSRAQQVAGVETGDIEILSVELCDEDLNRKTTFRSNETLLIRARVRAEKPMSRVVSSVSLRDPSGLVVSIERSSFHGISPFDMEGEQTLEIRLEPLQLKAGMYVVGLSFQDPSLQVAYCLRFADSFRVVEEMPNPGGKEGFFKPNISWSLRE
jgi:ABC-type polysaccharide/polyol phosphate transport system ATPase subunit